MQKKSSKDTPPCWRKNHEIEKLYNQFQEEISRAKFLHESIFLEIQREPT